MNISDQPSIYEINAAVFLNEQSSKLGSKVTFATVPDETWDEIKLLKVDAVWFMGVWERSPLAQKMAHNDSSLKKALPDLKEKDIFGSAYSIHHYVVDERFGGDDALAIARKKLKERGMSIILDYVPNHVAIDHVWTRQHPNYFLPASQDELLDFPDDFYQTPSGIIARAKDPNFPPWSDVVQLNAFSPELRQAVTETLLKISSMCDGVRCDMAMLMMNDVFHHTWGHRAGHAPQTEYWPTIISEIKRHHPHFIFIAEVYWHKEKALLEQGFDLCYDKNLYDALDETSVHGIRKILHKDNEYQRHLLRFIENHDEPRAAKVFSSKKHEAAAVIISTLPGVHMYHDGEFEGKKVKLPVHLARRRTESLDIGISQFYSSLLGLLDDLSFKKGAWSMLETRESLPFIASSHILAWLWERGTDKYIVMVNYSKEPTRGRVILPEALHLKNPSQLFGSKDIDATKITKQKSIDFAPWQYSIVRL
ncbi:MAG: alpha-amylase [Candidatus Saccharibacteria bacterium]|nr:alpha-amylase [Candidatus Saccharibacteria bacterium]